MIKKLYAKIARDSLYQNSIYVIASTFVMAVFGFVFWIIVARIFPIESIGIATTLVSLTILISNFTHLGLNIGLIRYLPKSTNRSDTITTSWILVTANTILITVLLIVGLKVISPKLLFLQSNILYIFSFILFMIGYSLNVLIEGIFIAYRAARNILIKDVVLSTIKLTLPVFMITLGAYGIFAAISIGTFVGVLLSIGILVYKYDYHPAPVFNMNVLKKMAHFSGGNYVAGFLFQAPTLLLPLLILNVLHAKAAAYYYIDSMILNLLIIIPLATTNAFLAEGAYDATQLKSHFIKAAKIIFSLLIPSVAVIYFFGNIILHFFGKEFESEAFQFLQLISVSAIFIAVTHLGNAILRIRHQITALILMSLLGCALVLGLCFAFISNGLVGVGWGWLLGQAILAGAYILLFGKEALVRK